MLVSFNHSPKSLSYVVMPDSYLGKISDYFHFNNENN